MDSHQSFLPLDVLGGDPRVVPPGGALQVVDDRQGKPVVVVAVAVVWGVLLGVVGMWMGYKHTNIGRQ